MRPLQLRPGPSPSQGAGSLWANLRQSDLVARSRRHRECGAFAVSYHLNADRLTDLHSLQGMRVIINILDRFPCQLDNDVAGFQTGLGRRAAFGYPVQFLPCDSGGIAVFGDSAEIGSEVRPAG